MRKVFIPVITSVALAAFIVGCSTSGYQKAASATDSLDNTRQELRTGNSQVGAMVGTLSRLTVEGGGDLQTKYDKLVEDIKNIERQANRVRAKSNLMTSKGNSYFVTWEQELNTINNPAFKERSEQRRAELINSYRQIIVEMEKGGEAFRPFLADVQDIQKSLSTDLTPAGVQAISDLIEEAKQEAQNVQRHIGAVIREIDVVESKLSPKGS